MEIIATWQCSKVTMQQEIFIKQHTCSTSSQIEGCSGLKVEDTKTQEPGSKPLDLSNLLNNGEQ